MSTFPYLFSIIVIACWHAFTLPTCASSSTILPSRRSPLRNDTKPWRMTRQGETSPTILDDFRKPQVIPLLLRRGSVPRTDYLTAVLPLGVQQSDVSVEGPVILEGSEILPEAKLRDANLQKQPNLPNQTLVVTMDSNFNKLVGKVHVQIVVKYPSENGTENVTVHHFFNIIGAVIYRPTGKAGDLTKYTGKNSVAMPLIVPNADKGEHIEIYNASIYRGDDAQQSHNLRREDLYFDVPANGPLRWTRANCSVFADEGDLNDDCSIAFSQDEKSFMVRTTSDLDLNSAVEDLSIKIMWDGLQSLEQEYGLPLNAKNEDTDIINEFRLEVEGGGRHNKLTSGSGAVPTIVIVITSLLLFLALSTLFCCWCVCGKSRGLTSLDKSRNMRWDAKVRNWFHGDVSSLRTEAGRTVGVLEDPLSDGDARFMALNKNAAAGLAYAHNTAGPSDGGGGGSGFDSQPQRFSVEDTDPMDGLVPLDRLSEDKSVTKLVLPRGRGIRRGIELEVSTDGGSSGTNGTSGGASNVTGRQDDSGSGSSGRRRETGYSGTTGGGETGQGSGTDATSDPTGTVIVDDTRGDSSNRDGVEAAIDRVRQVDLLLGPASRGLVGRNGEPIHGIDSLEEEVDSKKAPDSGIIITLETLS